MPNSSPHIPHPDKQVLPQIHTCIHTCTLKIASCQNNYVIHCGEQNCFRMSQNLIEVYTYGPLGLVLACSPQQCACHVGKKNTLAVSEQHNYCIGHCVDFRSIYNFTFELLSAKQKSPFDPDTPPTSLVSPLDFQLKVVQNLWRVYMPLGMQSIQH